MGDHGDQFTSPSQDEEYIENYDTFTPTITEATIYPEFAVSQPYPCVYTDEVLQLDNQIQQHNSESSHFVRPTISAGIMPQGIWQSENHYQQQIIYTPICTPTYAPASDIPFEQLAVSHFPTHQTTTQINASYDADASSNFWSPGVCRQASCLAKPLDKQNNYQEYSDWRRHWFRVHEKQYQCLLDDAMFGTAKDLERHDDAKHRTGAKRHYCYIAGCQARVREFNRKDKFKEHNDRWHGPYFCPVLDCGRGNGNGFQKNGSLTKHMRTCHGL
ncbi:putative transcription factor c2h2 protein [Botrytis fragariae]|uniref:Putative transcription factor c2h2 protein n=1 Tax=Botrytis fragariae TaxID=1964551 RepID=A0A8H6ECT9_9HELO|nr:putative transcription factor c2h2 protein [Botrytis fragariae]KAF5867689.1 putative transcription factor c2h2 protein [Botrytis fragariae]